MRKRGPARKYRVVDVVLSRCPECGSSRRSQYEKSETTEARGVVDGQPFNAIVFRACQCLECGQWRKDRSKEWIGNQDQGRLDNAVATVDGN